MYNQIINPPPVEKTKLSRYYIWILVGICLGYKIVPYPKRKRIFQFVASDGEVKDLTIHKSAIVYLFKNGFLKFKENGGLRLSTNGFDVAYDRIFLSGWDS